MTIVRQDEMPARRRYRHERLAALALLALGSNLGCGKEILRVPGGQVSPSTTASSPSPLAAMRRAQPGPAPAPVALRAEYGSSLDELFLSSYMNPVSYGAQIATRPAPQPIDPGPGSPSSGDLLAACEDSQIPPPAWRPSTSPRRPVDPNDAFAVAQIPPPRVADGQGSDAFADAHIPPPRVGDREVTDGRAGTRPGEMTLADASSATRIALPKPPKARVRTQSSSLAEASVDTGIGPPVAPLRPTKVFRASRPEASGSEPGSAFDATRIAPPVPARPRPEESSGSHDSAFEVSHIPPPAPAESRRTAATEPADLPGLPPRQLDASVFAMPKEPADGDAPPAPIEPPAGGPGEPSDLSSAFEATRIAPPSPVRGTHPPSGGH